MEQPNYFATLFVDTSDIRTLVVITGKTREGKIVRIVGSVVLASNDVIDLKRE